MPDIQLIALDLDNTLFDANKQVSFENRQAIAQAREKGVKVVLTTGRPLPALGHLLSELGLDTADDYCVTLNGGCVQSNQGQVIFEQGFTYETVLEISQLLLAHGLPADVLSGDFVCSIAPNGHPSLYPLANPLLKFVVLERLSDLPQERHFDKVVSVQEADYLDQQIATLPMDFLKQFEAFKSREIIFEIMPKGIHKARGLQELTRHLNIPQNAVMAIGDEANDLSMISWAGVGVAMQNAIGPVKNVAQWVTTKDNNNSGVAQAIHRFVREGDV